MLRAAIEAETQAAGEIDTCTTHPCECVVASA
jgi:hypothetical protein